MFDTAAMSGQEIAKGLLLLMGIAFIIMAMMSFVLSYFVALNARPDRRALWLAGVPYIVACLAFIFGMPDLLIEVWGPIVAIVPAAIVFLWWRHEFRKAWVDDESQLPEGVKLANSDWRIGLATIAALIAAAILKRLIRGF